jgi:hypothetical protein
MLVATTKQGCRDSPVQQRNIAAARGRFSGDEQNS